MKKIAVIFESSPFDRKGQFNAAHQHISHLVSSGECEVDAYCIHSRDNAFTRKVRHTPQAPDVENVAIDGISYRLLWYRFSIIDHFTVEYLHRRPLLFGRFMNRCMSHLKGYDAIVAHSFTGGLFALEAFRRFGIPYFVTWHGSDVHTHPWKNPLVLEWTRRVMEAARCNFFVSRNLLDHSEKICGNLPKEVLYNGVSEDFVRFSDEDRAYQRNIYGLEEDTKVVAFVGSIVNVKNPDLLQPIFNKVRSMYEGPLEFWVVGDGKVRSKVEPALLSDQTIDVRMWGNVPSERMPLIMNCIDVMVLPSRNEGLPLVCAEAIRCGAVAVGADVGGVSEVVGCGHVVPHGDGFIDAIAAKVVDALNGGSSQSVPDHLDWKKTARKELEFIKGI